MSSFMRLSNDLLNWDQIQKKAPRHKTEAKIQWVDKSNLILSVTFHWLMTMSGAFWMEQNRLSRNLVRTADSSWASNNVWLPKGKQQLPSRNFINQQCRRIPKVSCNSYVFTSLLFADRAAVQIFPLTTSTRKPKPEAKKIFAMRHDNDACSGDVSYIANRQKSTWIFSRTSVDKQTSLKM